MFSISGTLAALLNQQICFSFKSFFRSFLQLSLKESLSSLKNPRLFAQFDWYRQIWPNVFQWSSELFESTPSFVRSPLFHVKPKHSKHSSFYFHRLNSFKTNSRMFLPFSNVFKSKHSSFHSCRFTSFETIKQLNIGTFEHLLSLFLIPSQAKHPHFLCHLYCQ